MSVELLAQVYQSTTPEYVSGAGWFLLVGGYVVFALVGFGIGSRRGKMSYKLKREKKGNHHYVEILLKERVCKGKQCKMKVNDRVRVKAKRKLDVKKIVKFLEEE
ncbi:MAG: hypothetical protein S4CHLAM102_05350 [Chlamydiia bacterium]|nr:hypothetical protein [Chlamydiia bacterium]